MQIQLGSSRNRRRCNIWRGRTALKYRVASPYSSRSLTLIQTKNFAASHLASQYFLIRPLGNIQALTHIYLSLYNIQDLAISHCTLQMNP